MTKYRTFAKLLIYIIGVNSIVIAQSCIKMNYTNCKWFCLLFLRKDPIQNCAVGGVDCGAFVTCRYSLVLLPTQYANQHDVSNSTFHRTMTFGERDNLCLIKESNLKSVGCYVYSTEKM